MSPQKYPDSSSRSPAEALRELIGGYRSTQLVYAAAKLGDIMMMTLLGGLERTGAEYGALFELAGLNLTRIIPTRSPFSIIEGVPV